MPSQRVRKTYTPREMKLALDVLQEVLPDGDAAGLVKRLYDRGFRVVYAGKLQYMPPVDTTA